MATNMTTEQWAAQAYAALVMIASKETGEKKDAIMGVLIPAPSQVKILGTVAGLKAMGEAEDILAQERATARFN